MADGDAGFAGTLLADDALTVTRIRDWMSAPWGLELRENVPIAGAAVAACLRFIRTAFTREVLGLRYTMAVFDITTGECSVLRDVAEATQTLPELDDPELFTPTLANVAHTATEAMRTHNYAWVTALGVQPCALLMVDKELFEWERDRMGTAEAEVCKKLLETVMLPGLPEAARSAPYTWGGNYKLGVYMPVSVVRSVRLSQQL